MRVVVVGYGVQGKKRRRVAGADFAGIVDPVAQEADWRNVAARPDPGCAKADLTIF